MPKISIAAATEAIRQARRVEFLGTTPAWRWRIRNTAGDSYHELTYDKAREDVVCLSCESKYGANRCWARLRVLEWMARHARTGKLPNVRRTSDSDNRTP